MSTIDQLMSALDSGKLSTFEDILDEELNSSDSTNLYEKYGGYTLMQMAAEKSKDDVVQLMLQKYEADSKIVDEPGKGYTALNLIIENNQRKVVDKLLKSEKVNKKTLKKLVWAYLNYSNNRSHFDIEDTVKLKTGNSPVMYVKEVHAGTAKCSWYSEKREVMDSSTHSLVNFKLISY